ncbi:hypothetical protein AWRI1631_11040020 [Saccharomyces cerevisiae AWRI1631]|uniref:Aspartate aminotransferase n=1 Tax=Saccharomyces cerevisiae (strain AWRI1631) TaxID=545124 RepID=B5VTZ8_YEAS6|nr:hypothetical protein AWRI1631_11040020 [Saccharomyces cerevisiae AWRI1631]
MNLWKQHTPCPLIFLSEVPYLEPDAIFALTAQFKEDESACKVNLGQGTYRDGNGQPWVLESVKRAKEFIRDSGHEYLPILGLKRFRSSCSKILFGTDSSIVVDNRVATSQAVSGTGSIHLAAVFLARCYSTSHHVYISDPSWSNHAAVFRTAGFPVEKYPYLDNDSGGLAFSKLLESLKVCSEGSIFVLHACAHNPTGLDPSEKQWRQIAAIMKERNLFPIFDAAYLGFNSGSFDTDSWAIRYFFHEMDFSGIVCMSFSKNMGLYGERVGCVQVVTKSPEQARNVESVLESLQRAEISNPPAFGARIADAILANEDLKLQWKEDMLTMAHRIRNMRELLVDCLELEKAPGSWDHISNQSGMFGFLGLTESTVNELKKTHHIYMAANSRISIAGLNESNTRYVAKCIAAVLSGKQNLPLD